MKTGGSFKYISLATASLFVLAGCTSSTSAEDQSVVEATQSRIAEATENPEPELAPTFELSTLRIDSDLCKFEDQTPEFASRRPMMHFTYFPNMQTDPYFLPTTGELNLAMVLVDWADKDGGPTDEGYYREQAQIMTDWVSLVSQDKLTLNWRISDQWNEMEGSWVDYAAPDADNMSDEQRAPLEQWIVDKAVSSSDDNFDYTGIDYVIFAMPLSGSFTTQMMPIGEVVMTSGAHGFAFDVHPSSGRATVVRSEEASIGNWVISGTTFQDQKNRSPSWVHWAHEMGHMFGYISHAPLPDVDMWADQSAYFKNPMTPGGIFAHQWNPVRAVSGWTSWVAGWLNDEQIQCVDGNEVQDEIFAVNNSRLEGGQTKALIIKTGETTGLVVESREWNPDIDTPTSKGEAGFYDGIFMYYIDSSRPISDESLIPLAPHGTNEVWDEDMWPGTAVSSVDLMFQEGESADYRDFNIEVLSMQDGVDYVRVTRKGS